jgi:DUF971 family protein
MSVHRPTEIRLRRKSRSLDLTFEDGASFALPAEYLRVHSPSAEVRGHGPGQEVLQVGKEHVGIAGVEPVGQYAIRIVFDDGHDTGLYSWDYLYDLGANQPARWRRYLERLAAAGHPRPDTESSP